jgi:hypothetical protein
MFKNQGKSPNLFCTINLLSITLRFENKYFFDCLPKVGKINIYSVIYLCFIRFQADNTWKYVNFQCAEGFFQDFGSHFLRGFILFREKRLKYLQSSVFQ